MNPSSARTNAYKRDEHSIQKDLKHMLHKLTQKCPGMEENPVFQRMLEYSKLEQKASAQNPSHAFKTKGVEYLEQVRTIIALLDRTHAVKNDALLSEEDVRGFLLCVRRFVWFLVVFQQGEQVFQSSLHAKNTRAQLSSIYEKMLSKTHVHAFRLYLKGMQMELDDFYDRVLEPHKRSPHFSDVETLVLC